MIDGGSIYDINDFRVDDLRNDVQHDLMTFERLYDLVTEDKIPPERDAKVQVFLSGLPEMLRKGKLLIFYPVSGTLQITSGTSYHRM